ncbi:Centromere/kinetochore protein zw10 [Podospora aff. communis PSN243]|uniref:Centromere/kinetochore protein zw10 n=1 Tax=Podospora aff. communis PSN243 TaxID=3040156 RepID=A0AAV9GJE7_9PEZI|nr:Centromere/kinetochore protein zw10 [Podospora aff. communis PSN243]
MPSSPDDGSKARQIAQALVDFSVDGAFPEETVVTLAVDSNALPAAIEALTSAKSKLQAEVHAINEETAEDVRAWQANAQSVQDDIVRSKALANQILREGDTPDVSGKAEREAEAKAEFLVRELNYNQQVQNALRGIKGVSTTLDLVEQARDERRILDALHLLERSWNELDTIPVNKSCRAIRLLDIRAFELKSDVYEVFDRVWNSLIHVDAEAGRISVGSPQEDEPMTLADAVIGLKAYKEVDKRTSQLWQDINKAVILPRMDIARQNLPGIQVNGDALQLHGTTDKSVNSLFADLTQIFSFLVQRLPQDLVETISTSLLPEVIHKITKVWLDSAVPASLQDMDQFQDVIAAAKDFCDKLKSLGLTNLGDLQEWSDSAPRVWLSKCREAALDSVRVKFSQGLGASTRVERVDKQMVSKSEGQQLAANGATTDVDDHGWDAWDDGEQETEEEAVEEEKAEQAPAEGDDDGTDAWGWGDDDGDKEEKPVEADEKKPEEDEDDPTEAWGWGDEAADEPIEPEVKPQPAKPKSSAASEPREVVFKETYNISSMPQPVLDLIYTIAEDGAALTQDVYATSPVAASAAGLFSLPTLALAMFRAVSPYYYALDVGGKMYLYNDATYLSERLADFAAAWKKREDITTRAQAMLRLDGDIKSLQNFANRAYSSEMNIQKTILRDLLGGDQSLMQQDDTENCVSLAVTHIRAMAIAWEGILSRSAWQQAVGSLADAVSSKVISDVMDMSSIGQDEAYNIAQLISTVTGLDDLFLPSRVVSSGQSNTLASQAGETDEVPTTAQYAASWLRLKYLSEVLQSNLKDVRFLWVESELSLYFTVAEVVDLINMSFEDNPRTREVIREITQNPSPLGRS